MKRLKVDVSDEVKLQISQQVFHIARDSISNALAWEDRLRSALNSLSDFYGHATDEEASLRLGEPVHKMVFEKTYLIHYQVNVSVGVVEIINFRHGARLPKTNEP